MLEYYGVSDGGNFEGANILHLPAGLDAEQPPQLDQARRALYAVRAERVWPDFDDKCLAAWNALAIAALADAGAVLGRDDYLDAARAAAAFVWDEMRGGDGHLLRSWKDGEAKLNAYLEDHAFLLEALLVLYESTFEVRWFDAARELAETMIERFSDRDRGGFFTTSNDQEKLIVRRKDVDDRPIPSGSSSAAFGLLRLAALTGESSYERQALSVFDLFARVATRHPHAVPHLLRAIDFHLAAVKEVALVAPAGGDGFGGLDAMVRAELRPHVVVAGAVEGAERPELMLGRSAVEGRAAAYVCESFSCRSPVTEPDELAHALDA